MKKTLENIGSIISLVSLALVMVGTSLVIFGYLSSLLASGKEGTFLLVVGLTGLAFGVLIKASAGDFNNPDV